MLNNNIEEMLKGLTESEIATLIGLAHREKDERDRIKEATYMAAIIKAIQDYLDNVGDLTFHVEYEDKDGQGEAEIICDNLNPPAGDQGTIWL